MNTKKETPKSRTQAAEPPIRIANIHGQHNRTLRVSGLLGRKMGGYPCHFDTMDIQVNYVDPNKSPSGSGRLAVPLDNIIIPAIRQAFPELHEPHANCHCLRCDLALAVGEGRNALNKGAIMIHETGKETREPMKDALLTLVGLLEQNSGATLVIP